MRSTNSMLAITDSLDDVWALPSLLANFTPPDNVNYLENPAAWLEARGDHILSVTKGVLKLSKAERIQCAEWALRGQYEVRSMSTSYPVVLLTS
jgi:hypothetical protein